MRIRSKAGRQRSLRWNGRGSWIFIILGLEIFGTTAVRAALQGRQSSSPQHLDLPDQFPDPTVPSPPRIPLLPRPTPTIAVPAATATLLNVQGDDYFYGAPADPKAFFTEAPKPFFGGGRYNFGGGGLKRREVAGVPEKPVDWDDARRCNKGICGSDQYCQVFHPVTDYAELKDDTIIDGACCPIGKNCDRPIRNTACKGYNEATSIHETRTEIGGTIYCGSSVPSCIYEFIPMGYKTAGTLRIIACGDFQTTRTLLYKSMKAYLDYASYLATVTTSPSTNGNWTTSGPDAGRNSSAAVTTAPVLKPGVIAAIVVSSVFIICLTAIIITLLSFRYLHLRHQHVACPQKEPHGSFTAPHVHTTGPSPENCYEVENSNPEMSQLPTTEDLEHDNCYTESNMFMGNVYQKTELPTNATAPTKMSYTSSAPIRPQSLSPVSMINGGPPPGLMPADSSINSVPYGNTGERGRYSYVSRQNSTVSELEPRSMSPISPVGSVAGMSSPISPVGGNGNFSGGYNGGFAGYSSVYGNGYEGGGGGGGRYGQIQGQLPVHQEEESQPLTSNYRDGHQEEYGRNTGQGYSYQAPAENRTSSYGNINTSSNGSQNRDSRMNRTVSLNYAVYRDHHESDLGLSSLVDGGVYTSPTNTQPPHQNNNRNSVVGGGSAGGSTSRRTTVELPGALIAGAGRGGASYGSSGGGGGGGRGRIASMPPRVPTPPGLRDGEGFRVEDLE